MVAKILTRLIILLLIFGACVAGCGGNNQASSPTPNGPQDAAKAAEARKQGEAAAIARARAEQQQKPAQ